MRQHDALIADIRRLAQPVCDEIGIEIVQVNVNPHQGVVHLQVFADRPQGGIGMEECATLNRRLVQKIDSDLDLGADYTLEVSSPGLDRPLSGYHDLRRVLGQELQVFLKERVQGKGEFSGFLKAVSEADIILETRKGEVLLPMDKIDKAKQIIN